MPKPKTRKPTTAQRIAGLERRVKKLEREAETKRQPERPQITKAISEGTAKTKTGRYEG